MVTIKPKTLNLAIETIIQMDNSDKQTNLQIIENLQRFLNKIRTAIDGKQSRRNAGKDFLLTKYLQEIIRFLKEIDKDDLEDIIIILNDKVRETNSNDEIPDEAARKYWRSVLNRIKSWNVEYLREQLEAAAVLLENPNNNVELRNLFNFANDAYKNASADDFYKVLDQLRLNPRKKSTTELAKNINECINIVIGHYKSMPKKTKNKFEKKFKKLIEFNHDAMDDKGKKLYITTETIHVFRKNPKVISADNANNISLATVDLSDYSDINNNGINDKHANRISLEGSSNHDSDISNDSKESTHKVAHDNSREKNYLNNKNRVLQRNLKRNKDSVIHKRDSENEIIATNSKHKVKATKHISFTKNNTKPYIDLKTFDKGMSELLHHRKSRGKKYIKRYVRIIENISTSTSL